MQNPYESFFKVKNQFQLGKLTTESFHPLSSELSDLCHNDLASAFDVMMQIDDLALSKLEPLSSDVYKLAQKINQTFKNNGKIFFVGCGATGRLSLSIETIWRHQTKREDVVSFMAGGDYALIKSVEKFEDSAEFGKRQLHDLGFSENDLLVAITEGGETNFVIGAAMEASRISKISPHFLYCNPKNELMGLERCANLFNNPQIDTLELVIGPMALSGSTRMQATTVQMFAATMALYLNDLDQKRFEQEFKNEVQKLKDLDYSSLELLTELEAEIYKKNELVTYKAQERSAMTILTDTTERSPTFSLASFEKTYENFFCPGYLVLENTFESASAWNRLLARSPRGLNWEDIDQDLSLKEIYQFDISERHLEKRSKHNKNVVFSIDTQMDGFIFTLDTCRVKVLFSSENPFVRQIALKMMLNAHSTLLMGRLGRFESNVMTWVKPSNLKLIDRTTRYVVYLGERRGIKLDYDKVAAEVISLAKLSQFDRPIVLEVLEKLHKG